MTTQGIMLTAPERAVEGALVKLQVEFEMQTPFMGGRPVTGGVVADFFIPSLSLIISVLGFYYHYNQPDTESRDAMQKVALASQGITTIYIDEADALRNALYYVKEALAGRDHSLETR